MLSNSSDINLNVSISPQISPVQNAQKLKTENVCDNERKVKKKKSKRRKKRSRHSSTSSSEDVSRHRLLRRKMLFSNANPPVFPAYNHPAVDPYFSTGHHMPYMIPPYTGTYEGSNVHYPYSAGITTTQQTISFGTVIAPRNCQGVNAAMAHQNLQFNYEHQDTLPILDLPVKRISTRTKTRYTYLAMLLTCPRRCNNVLQYHFILLQTETVGMS